MSFRGWELRIPLRVFNPSGQLLISSTLPLTARYHTTSFGLCLSDATADYLRNPILVVHSNATLASVRKLVGLVVPVCLYALANTTTQFAFGSEVLSLDSIKPPGVSGLHELTNRNRQAPLSDPKSETPLGHKLDREAIGELGFQTGRTLVIRLRSHTELQGFGNDINGASSFTISDSMHSSLLRRSSGLSMKSSGSGKLHPPPLPHVASSVSSSSFLPKVASFLHSEKQNPPMTAANVNAIDPACLQSPFTLPSLMLASSRSVYESVFELAENDLAENGPSQIRPNLLHMIRLLLYCLPTYHPPNGLHVSERSGKGASKSVSNAFAASMVCTPENLVKAPQFRLLYLLQVRNFCVLRYLFSFSFERITSLFVATINWVYCNRFPYGKFMLFYPRTVSLLLTSVVGQFSQAFTWCISHGIHLLEVENLAPTWKWHFQLN